jgi:hypothetical protein
MPSRAVVHRALSRHPPKNLSPAIGRGFPFVFGSAKRAEAHTTTTSGGILPVDAGDGLQALTVLYVDSPALSRAQSS